MFKNGEVIESWGTSPSTRRKVEPEVRISQLIGSLNVPASQWQTQIVALRQPSSINWPVPALDLLASSLLEWSTERGHPRSPTPAQEVRAAIAGHSNASRAQLAYATMLLLG